MWDITSVREQFPALQRDCGGRPPVFLDGPGGSQVPRPVIDAMVEYLSRSNANCGGAFVTSHETERMLEACHQAGADFLNASSPDEISFGANMTTITLHVSRAIARTLRPGDEVIVTKLDHDANVSPWVLAARDAGAVVRKIDVRPEDCTLDMTDFERQLSPRTRVVAVTAASNLVGSLTDVAAIASAAHAHDALVWVDAVHAAPHVALDVQALGCDFLVCSAYKFFGPHVGMLWGRRKWLEELPAYKLRPSSNELPWRWQTGTMNHEGLAGTLAALEYLASVGRAAGDVVGTGRRQEIRRAMLAIRAHERELAAHLLEELARHPRFKVWGVKDPGARTPTIAITARDRSPEELARALGARHVFSWAGNLYAIELTERLGVEASGGLLRLGLMHYNTHEEIERVMAALIEA